MDIVIRGIVVYLFLFAVLRASGNRQFSELTTFDLVLLLIIAEATQGALLGGDESLTAAGVMIVTLVGVDIALSHVKERSRTAGYVIEGVPVLLVDDGTLLEDNMRRERVGANDILTSARENHGLESIEQVKYAVLERDGKISIVPYS